MSIKYPLINGVRHDFSSIEAKIAGRSFLGFEEITYSHSREPGDVYGTHAQRIGRTRGQYKAEAAVVMYKAEYADFIASLGDGYMEKTFELVVSYSERFDGRLKTITDRIVGCTIRRSEDSHRQGNEALRVRVELDPMYVLENALPGKAIHPLHNMKR